jgi:hypothetical protein
MKLRRILKEITEYIKKILNIEYEDIALHEKQVSIRQKGKRREREHVLREWCLLILPLFEVY